VDQVSKLYVKTNFVLGKLKFSMVQNTFIENEGMAWGTKIPGAW
jgi:signal peptidase II